MRRFPARCCRNFVRDPEVLILLSLPDLSQRFVVNDSGRHPNPLYSENGSIVAIALEDRLVAWSTKDGRELCSKPGMQAKGYRFSPDGSRLIAWQRSKGANSTLLVYDATSGRELAQLPQQGDATVRSDSPMVSVVNIDEGGHKLISRNEHTAYLWDVDTATHRVDLNMIVEDTSRRKADMEALSSSKRLDRMSSIGKKYLNACLGN